ncbi:MULTISPECIES: hypothetical protein [Pseudomonas]|uniref:hypothetical protein n=1 Tax=Pseudomonas sp. WS 5410 TaxID=2717485 RepID=UPI00070905A0|nr:MULTISPECIES: hypothetical protein [Pseudomonas]MDD0979978.1 hypothetical protein [Pseudomonas shahriarae]
MSLFTVEVKAPNKSAPSADAFYLGADHFSRGENQLITRFCIVIRTIGIGVPKAVTTGFAFPA